MSLALAAPNVRAESELRGAWIHSPTGTADWGWDKTVKTLAENGFNALFANLSWTVSSDYPSQVSVPHPTICRNADGTVRDRLRECLDACRKYGVQLHVWVVVCNMGDHTPLATRAAFRNANRTQKNAAGNDSDYLAPQLPENRELIRSVLSELVRNYEIDGVHLDYIRYPLGAYDCSESARRDFEAARGTPVADWPAEILPKGALRAEYRQWCRDNITELVRISRAAVKSVRPEVQFSVAVYGLWKDARESVAQDAAAWVDQGLVDFLCPMNYSGDPADARKWLQLQLDAVRGRVPIYTGLANYMCADIAALREEIRDSRKLGADGFICFQLKENFAREWLPLLHAAETAAPASAPVACGQPRPAFAWRNVTEPVARGLFGWLRRTLFAPDPPACTVVLPPELAPDRTRLPQVTLLRDGVSCDDVPFRSEWQSEGTLRLQMLSRPPTGHYYRWEIVLAGELFRSTTAWIPSTATH